MPGCPACGGVVEALHRYCPWCAAPLRLKLVEFFRGHEELDSARALRVSRYLADEPHGPHVRLSIWSESEHSARAEAAVSLGDDEAGRLARFLAVTAPARPRTLVERLYASLLR